MRFMVKEWFVLNSFANSRAVFFEFVSTTIWKKNAILTEFGDPDQEEFLREKLADRNWFNHCWHVWKQVPFPQTERILFAACCYWRDLFEFIRCLVWIWFKLTLKLWNRYKSYAFLYQVKKRKEKHRNIKKKGHFIRKKNVAWNWLCQKCDRNLFPTKHQFIVIFNSYSH